MAESWTSFNDITDDEFAGMPRIKDPEFEGKPREERAELIRQEAARHGEEMPIEEARQAADHYARICELEDQGEAQRGTISPWPMASPSVAVLQAGLATHMRSQAASPGVAGRSSPGPSDD